MWTYVRVKHETLTLQNVNEQELHFSRLAGI